MKKIIIGVLILFICSTTSEFELSGSSFFSFQPNSGLFPLSLQTAAPVYLPFLTSGKDIRRVNAPFYDNKIIFNETAIIWFGKVSLTDSYADIRIAYTSTELYLWLAVIDRLVWYDTTPTPADLTNWDSVSIYLNMNGDKGSVPTSNSYRFDAQVNWWEPRTNWQAVYQGNGIGWRSSSAPFTTESNWKGNAPNDDTNDRGWNIVYHIPFTSLGLSTAPSLNKLWGLGVVLHNRNSLAGPPNPDKYWPESMRSNVPSSWGQLGFGNPGYTPAAYTNPIVTTIRQGLNGVQVVDGMVGGGNLCGEPLNDSNFFDKWGNVNYAGMPNFNIQNQANVDDWPCFSKDYMTFPLSSLPPGKVIVSAKLILHQFGNAGAPGQALPSFIQVMRVNQDWNVSTLTWNNAPLASENYGGTWVYPMAGPIVWPGVPYEWEITRAVVDAYREGKPLRLALYESDWDLHSGKYFVSSNGEEWNAEGRPTIQITWGNPLP
jgi:hypothetical protein